MLFALFIAGVAGAVAIVWGMFWRSEAHDLLRQLGNMEHSRDFWRDQYTPVALEAQAYRNHAEVCPEARNDYSALRKVEL